MRVLILEIFGRFVLECPTYVNVNRKIPVNTNLGGV